MSPESLLLTIFTSAANMLAQLNTLTYFGIGIISVLVILFILYYLVPMLFKLFGYDLGDE